MLARARELISAYPCRAEADELSAEKRELHKNIAEVYNYLVTQLRAKQVKYCKIFDGA